MLHRDYPGLDCSVAKALEVIGERWSLLIVRSVMHGNRRFGEMQESLGIARNVLSARLQRLIDEDILERRAYQESPPRYEYFLTQKGLDLWPALIALLNWGDRYSPDPERPATADRPQGVRRHRQRARHLRKLRQAAHGARREAGARAGSEGASGRFRGDRLAFLGSPPDLVCELHVLEHHQLVLPPARGSLHRNEVAKDLTVYLDVYLA